MRTCRGAWECVYAISGAGRGCLSPFVSSTCSRLTETRRESGPIISTDGAGRKQEVAARIRPPACLAYGEIRCLRLNARRICAGDMTTGTRRRKSEATALTKSAEWITQLSLPRSLLRAAACRSVPISVFGSWNIAWGLDIAITFSDCNVVARSCWCTSAAAFYAHPSHTELGRL